MKRVTMSLFSVRLQIVSDLNLETPLNRPQYSKFRLDIQANKHTASR